MVKKKEELERRKQDKDRPSRPNHCERAPPPPPPLSRGTHGRSAMPEPEQEPIRLVEHGHARCWLGGLMCLLLACLYVGSLYVWRSSLPRDHPSVIKRRCASVLLVSAFSPTVVKAWMHLDDIRVDASVWELMGLRLEGLAPAALFPLLLTALFYLGPLVHSAVDDPEGFGGELRSALDVQAWRSRLADAMWLRNQVVAPVTEELVFRGAMLPMLVPCTGPTAAVFAAPLFFGVAHLHHIIEQRRLNKDCMSIILLVAGMQFLYTSVFGAFTAFVFVRTGHVAGPVLCHAFCNSQGLPDVGAALRHRRRSPLLLCYLMGALMFLLLLFPLTDPVFFSAVPVCSLAPPPASVC